MTEEIHPSTTEGIQAILDAVNRYMRSFDEVNGTTDPKDQYNYSYPDVYRHHLTEDILTIYISDDCTVRATGFFYSYEDSADLQAVVLFTDVYHGYLALTDEACSTADLRHDQVIQHSMKGD